MSLKRNLFLIKGVMSPQSSINVLTIFHIFQVIGNFRNDRFESNIIRASHSLVQKFETFSLKVCCNLAGEILNIIWVWNGILKQIVECLYKFTKGLSQNLQYLKIINSDGTVLNPWKIHKRDCKLESFPHKFHEST